MVLQELLKARYFCCMRNFLASKLKRALKEEAPEEPEMARAPEALVDNDIVLNGNFDEGLEGWSPSYGCNFSVCDSATFQGVQPHNGRYFAAVSRRTQGWQGIQQDITNRLLPGVKYQLVATVRILGGASEADVLATVKMENKGSETKYMQLGRAKALRDTWTELRGTLLLEVITEKVILYFEGPPSGIDILVDSVHLRPESGSSSLPGKQTNYANPSPADNNSSVLINPYFSNGLHGWSGRSCTLLLGDASKVPQVSPCTGQNFAIAANRSQTWHGVEQDVTGRLRVNTMYDVQAKVRIRGPRGSKSDILATLYQRKANMQEQYMTIGRTSASTEDWSHLRGNFTIHSLPMKAIIFIEGPGAGIDILVDSFIVSSAKKPEPSPPPSFENPMFGCNIIQNSYFLQGSSGWFPMGSCSLRVASGAPKVAPRAANETLHFHRNYIVATNRKFGWEGPAQKLTDRIQVFLCYQVSAWVRVGGGTHKVNVALSIDGQWVTGGEVEACGSSWKEILGSFRLEKKPSDALVYVQGPPAGVDIMVANLEIFSVNRSERFAALKQQAEQVRKRDVVLRVRNASKFSSPLQMSIKQTKPDFPLGACINRSNLENSSYVDFFLKHFDITVFENELKWNWTEPEQGKLNYRDADELCNFCTEHNIPMRGHCVFWEVEHCVQGWVKKLSNKELETAIRNRITSLVTRYRGKFLHYDVNNEMLHGDFYRSRLGPQIHASMFKLIHQLDPSAKLFVNDYHVEDGKNACSCPENYIQHIQDLTSQGAPVGGIGIQGHLDVPIGPIMCQAFDKLAMLRLPIWLTEVDVCSSNQHVRGDDLEVVLREAFAHPAVEGVILWGFWEGCCRQDGHLVDVDAQVNPAGKVLQSLRREWSTEVSGCTDKEGKLQFRGYCGSYKVGIELGNGKRVERSFEVTKEGEQEIDINL